MIVKRLAQVEILPFSKEDLFKWIKCLNCSSPLPTNQLFSRLCDCGYRNMQYGTFILATQASHKALLIMAKECMDRMMERREYKE